MYRTLLFEDLELIEELFSYDMYIQFKKEFWTYLEVNGYWD